MGTGAIEERPEAGRSGTKTGTTGTGGTGPWNCSQPKPGFYGADNQVYAYDEQENFEDLSSAGPFQSAAGRVTVGTGDALEPFPVEHALYRSFRRSHAPVSA